MYIPHQTSNTAFMHPSFSGLLVTWAYFPAKCISYCTILVTGGGNYEFLPHITFPPCVTNPNSLTLISITVPFVMTPRDVYIGDEGFFLTAITGKQNVAFSSGCVT